MLHSDLSSSESPAFLNKLWKIVNDNDTNDLIHWSPKGTSFFIKDHMAFTYELIPRYFKHSNWASFVRQLNIYGFKKVPSLDSGSLVNDSGEAEFFHSYFKKGNPELLGKIKRKPQISNYSRLPTTVNEGNLDNVLAEVETMRRNQESLEQKFQHLTSENEMLWKEYASMRIKFGKQQQIMEKLVHFLVALVKNSSGPTTIGAKRKFNHLALENTTQRGSSSPSSSMSLQQLNAGDVLLESRGPVIHEISDMNSSDNLRAPEALTKIIQFPPSNSPPIQEVNSPIEPELLSPSPPQLLNDSEYDGLIFMGGNAKHKKKQKQEQHPPPTYDGEIQGISDPDELLSFETLLGDPSPDRKHETRTSRDDVTEVSDIHRQGLSSAHSSQLLKHTTEDPLDMEDSNLLLPVDINEVTPGLVANVSSVQPLIVKNSVNTPKIKSGTGSLQSPRKEVILSRFPHQKGRGSSPKGNFLAKPKPNNEVVALGGPACNDSSILREELFDQFDETQNSLDLIKELLSNGSLNVDTSTILSLFSPEDSHSGLSSLDTLNFGRQDPNTSGTEVSMYHPSLYDIMSPGSPSAAASNAMVCPPGEESGEPGEEVSVLANKKLRLTMPDSFKKNDGLETPRSFD